MGQGGILTQLFLDDIIFEQPQKFYELDYEKHPKQNRSYLLATASQAQHYSVSTLLNSTLFFSTLLDFNTSAFNTDCIQHYSYSTSTYSTHLAFNTPCIQHFLYSTLLDFNNHGFNTT